MDIRGYGGVPEIPQMLPPPPGSFLDREELIQHVSKFALTQGNVVTIKQSKKDKVVIKEMTDAGLKPRQILKRLRQSNPELLSTPKHVYNVKANL